MLAPFVCEVDWLLSAPVVMLLLLPDCVENCLAWLKALLTAWLYPASELSAWVSLSLARRCAVLLIALPKLISTGSFDMAGDEL